VILVSTEVSMALRLVATLGGLSGGLVAVWLAQTIPPRMEVEHRPRPTWWWAFAIFVGGAFGWLLPDSVSAWALLPAFLVFGGATLGIALIDLDHQLIPNRVLFPALGAGAVLLAGGALIEGDVTALVRGVLGGLTYFLILLIIGLAARGGFGMGDVKLALLLGLFLGYLGWGVLTVGAVLAILLGGVASILLLVVTRSGRNAKFAYGPYLVAGSWVAVMWGEQLVDWYLGAS